MSAGVSPEAPPPEPRGLRWLCRVGEGMARNVGAQTLGARMVALAYDWRQVTDPMELLAERFQGQEVEYLRFFKRKPAVDGTEAATDDDAGPEDVSYEDAFREMAGYETRAHKLIAQQRAAGKEAATELNKERYERGVAALVRGQRVDAEQLVAREAFIWQQLRRKAVVLGECVGRAAIVRQSRYMAPEVLQGLLHEVVRREVIVRSQLDQHEFAERKTLKRALLTLLCKDDAVSLDAEEALTGAEGTGRAALTADEGVEFQMLAAWCTYRRMLILTPSDDPPPRSAALTRRLLQSIPAYSEADVGPVP